MILGSANVSKLMLGSSAVSKVMLGSTEVWSAVDSDFAAYLAAGIANGSTMSAANQTAVNAFIVGCKADGIWSAIKASCLLCAWDSLAGALTPLVGPSPTNYNFGSGDFTRTSGLLGDGASKALGSNYSHSSAAQNSRSAWVYISTAGDTSSQRYIDDGGGASTGGSHLRISGSLRTTRCSSTSISLVTASPPTGLFGISRASASGYSVRVGGATNSITDTSSTPSTTNYTVFSRGLSSVPSGDYTTAEIAAYGFGDYIDLALLDARLTTLMAALT